MISDERLREAARKAEESILATLPEPEDCEVTLSPECESKMKKLIRHTNHPIRHRIMKAVACFLLAVLFGGGSVLIFSVEARATFVNWVKEVYETHFAYRLFQSDQDSLSNIVYQPTWVPSDYQMIDESVSDSSSTFVYKNESNKLAIFTCFRDTASSVFQVEREGIEDYTQVSINGISADLYLDPREGEANVLIWTDENEGVMYCISAVFGEDELIKMAESIEKSEY